MKNLLIVDDHQMFADGIQFLIEYATDFKVVGVLHSGQEVIPFLARHPTSLILLDINLPDQSGFDVLKAIRPLYPQLNVLALSMLNDMHSITRMMEAGAAGYCLKTAGTDELFRAIKQVDAGSPYLPLTYFNQRQQQKFLMESYGVTDRETEVIQLIAEGISTRQIADKLFLSTRTVETHRKNIYRKLAIHTNIELTTYARHNHII